MKQQDIFADTAETTTYRNSWYRQEGGYGPEFYEAQVRPVEYRGHLIYERIRGRCWDCVKDGVCVRQAAGADGARRLIDCAADAAEQEGST